MSFNEELFKKIDKFFVRLFFEIQDATSYKRNLCTVFLFDYSFRFSNFATIIAQRSIHVVESTTLSGVLGNKIFLPESICISKYIEVNVLAYLYRIVFSLTVESLGFYNLKGLTKKQSTVAFLVIVSCTHIYLFNMYPPFKFLASLLYMCVLKDRPNLEELSGSSLFFEICLRRLFFFEHFTYVCFEKSLSSKFFSLINSISTSFVKTQYELKKLVIFFSTKISMLFVTDSSFTIEHNILWGLFSFVIFSSVTDYISNTNIFPLLENKFKTVVKRKEELNVIVKKVTYGKRKNGDLPILSLFQNVRTAENYEGGVRDEDLSDDLKDHFDALNELNIDTVTCSENVTHSIFQSSIIMLNNFFNFFYGYNKDDFYKKFYFYDEWDFHYKKYRKKWCRVIELCPEILVRDGNFLKNVLQKYSSIINQLKRRIQFIFNQDVWKRRQLDGSEIDFDSFINTFFCLKLRKTMDNRLYLLKKKNLKTTAIYFILDSSLSTDSFFDSCKLITLIKEVTCVLGEVLNSIGGFFSVAYFYSNTHTRCIFVKIKDFKTKWSGIVDKIGAIVPQGYTRLGPAIRHAIFELKSVDCKRKVVILLSDSKPTDYDYYEGIYGIEDVRQVIRESVLCNVVFKSIVFVDRSVGYLNTMYGKGNFYCIHTKYDLKKQLTKVLLMCFGCVFT